MAARFQDPLPWRSPADGSRANPLYPSYERRNRDIYCAGTGDGPVPTQRDESRGYAFFSFHYLNTYLAPARGVKLLPGNKRPVRPLIVALLPFPDPPIPVTLCHITMVH